MQMRHEVAILMQGTIHVVRMPRSTGRPRPHLLQVRARRQIQKPVIIRARPRSPGATAAARGAHHHAHARAPLATGRGCCTGPPCTRRVGVAAAYRGAAAPARRRVTDAATGAVARRVARKETPSRSTCSGGTPVAAGAVRRRPHRRRREGEAHRRSDVDGSKELLGVRSCPPLSQVSPAAKTDAS